MLADSLFLAIALTRFARGLTARNSFTAIRSTRSLPSMRTVKDTFLRVNGRVRKPARLQNLRDNLPGNRRIPEAATLRRKRITLRTSLRIEPQLSRLFNLPAPEAFMDTAFLRADAEHWPHMMHLPITVRALPRSVTILLAGHTLTA